MNPTAQINPSTTSSNEKSDEEKVIDLSTDHKIKAKLRLDFDTDDNDDSTSSSSSSSLRNDESIKEAIRRAAEATSKRTKESKNEFNTRCTIDLSNDPDIRKYFGLEDDESGDYKDLDKTLNQDSKPTELNLIDIEDSTLNLIPKAESSSAITKTNSSLNSALDDLSLLDPNMFSNNNPAPAVSVLAIEDNPFSKDRFVDQVITQFEPQKDSLSDLKSLTSLSSTSSSSFSSMLNTNAILNPVSIPKTSAPKQTTYQSIIDEFDPISDDNQMLKANAGENKKSAFDQKNFSSLITPRPFQSTVQSKPNYNINMPLSASIQSIRPISAALNSSPIPTSQSQNAFNAFKTTASPYYATNFRNQPLAYRPVSFNLPNAGQPAGNNTNSNNILNTNLFLTPNAQVNFADLPSQTSQNQQQPKNLF
jgi:hypothetical protein